MTGLRASHLVLFLSLILALTAGCLAFVGGAVKKSPSKPDRAFLSIGAAVNSDAITLKASDKLTSLLSFRLDEEKVPCIHPIVRKALTSPLKNPLSAIDFERLFLFPSPSLAFDTLTKTAGIEEKNFELPALTATTFEEYIEKLTAVLKDASEKWQKAIAGINPEERPRLSSLAISCVKAMAEGETGYGKLCTEVALRGEAIDWAAAAAALRSALRTVSPESIETVRGLSGTLPASQIPPEYELLFKGEVLVFFQSEVGLVIIGGKGKNTYGADAAVIIDLGGDDVYLNNCGATRYETVSGSGIRCPVSIVLDLEGNDRYLGSRIVSTGSGLLGIGILFDVAGDDFYSSDILGQGAGFLGIGVLADLYGDDTYSLQELGQGAGFAGLGLLFDAEGDDNYCGAKFVQGFGGPCGTGFLIDSSGSDTYRAGPKHPCTYGTANVSHTVAQGSGWGLRGHAAGGLGLLLDLFGDDRYIAGNFSQATGYYLSMGVLWDRCGDDGYFGTRYCQGSSAHLGAGLFIEEGGDDRYISSIAAGKGGAWDLSAAWFLDLEGDDCYEAADLAFGAAAQNSFSFFLDGDGKDSYSASSMAFGLGGALSYDSGRGAPNLGVFLDIGGKEDQYHTDCLRNNTRLRRGVEGLFIDE